MNDSRANIESPRELCRRKCCRSFHGEHGLAAEGGPFPGTQGEPGSVRRCGHGQIWAWTNESYGIDLWEPLSWFLEPVRYLRAVRALRSGLSSVDEGNTDTDG